MADSSDRLHGLDAVRGYALMLGVVFHATMSFLPGQPVWVVTDTARSDALSVLFFTSHMFRMTTFFVIAGFFAHMTFHRRGAAAFVKDRAKRIALPLVIFWPIVIMGIVLAVGYGVYVATGKFPTQPPPTPVSAPAGSFPLTHLWFLYVLLLLYAATLTIRAALSVVDRAGVVRAGADRVVALLLRSPLGPLAMAVPVATTFTLTPQWLAFFGVTTPDNNLIPNPIAATQYGLSFAFGWVLHRQPGLLDHLRTRWALNLVAALALTTTCLLVLGLTPRVTPHPMGPEKLALAAAYAVGAWAWTFAVIGLALRFLADASPPRRYIADSSYWIYVIHLPIVMLLQAAVSRLDWPWGAKFAVVLGVGFAIMFTSYELLVRHTFIGALLNGRRVPWRRSKASAASLETAQ